MILQTFSETRYGLTSPTDPVFRHEFDGGRTLGSAENSENFFNFHFSFLFNFVEFEKERE